MSKIDLKFQVTNQNSPAYCGNCSWKGKVKSIKDIEDLDNRIEPGETVPVGECPRCGALAYIGKQGENYNQTIPFKLVDQSKPKARSVKGTIKVDTNGIYIGIDGFGENTAANGDGTPVGMELNNGHVRVLVWANINAEDPTHVIDMADAKESKHDPEVEASLTKCMTAVSSSPAL